MRSGMRNIEIGLEFSGDHKEYSDEQLRAIKELQIAGNLEVTTHAPFTGDQQTPKNLSGFSRDGFHEDVRKRQLTEIKHAIDFASKGTMGGPVTVHTGEFPHSFSKEDQNKDLKNWGNFEQYPLEKDDNSIYLVDKKTGKIQTIPKTIELWEKINPEKDFDNTKDLSKQIRKINWKTIEIDAKKQNKNPTKLLIDKFKKIQIEKLEGQKAEMIHRLKEMKMMAEQDKARGNTNSIYIQYAKDYEKNLVQIEGQIQDEKEEHLIPIEEYGVNRSADSLAELGKYAMNASKNTKKPIFISPENIYPEMGFGAHPQELKKLVQRARDKFTKDLEKKGYDHNKAKKLSQTHIKATLDTGHLNIWRKYWKENPNLNEKENNEKFQKWYKEQVKDLAKNNIIGHVHVSDNNGYDDSHMAAGKGNAPIKNVLDVLSEEEFDGKFIIEPHGGNVDHILTDSWQYLGIPTSAYSDTNWESLGKSYFENKSPTYNMVGQFSSKIGKEWMPWDEIGLE